LFLDPEEDFKKKELVFELRNDYLIGHVSRILPFRRRKLSENETSLLYFIYCLLFLELLHIGAKSVNHTFRKNSISFFYIV
jgi:hypothetical protein